MLGDELASALQNHLAFTQNEGDRTEVPSPQQIRNEVFDDRDQLGAHRAVGLQLQQIEQHREHVAAQVLAVFPLDFFVEILDLLVLQEIERRVEVVDRHETLALGRRFFFYLPAHRRRIRRAGVAAGRAPATADRRGGLLGALDRNRILAGELAECVGDELEVFGPEQRQEIIGRVRLQVLRLLQYGEEAHDLRVFDARFEGERTHAVLVKRPGDTLVALFLGVDRVILPAHFRLADVEDQIVGGLPDLAECVANVIDGALIDGIVREVELRRPHPFADDLHQLLDL